MNRGTAMVLLVAAMSLTGANVPLAKQLVSTFAADTVLFGDPAPFADPKRALEALFPYIEREIADGTRLHAMTRHVLGLFRSVPGARAFRRHLAVHGVKPDAGMAVLRDALALVVDTRNPMPHTAAA